MRHKFGSEHMLDLFQQVFHLMPIAVVVADRYFVVHGGLPRVAVTLNQLRDLPCGPLPAKPVTLQETILWDLLWSDPCEQLGRFQGRRGPTTAQFGPDVTQQFLCDNKLQLVIRSHEVTGKGHMCVHGGKLVSIFSASNYCGQRGNMGAVLHLTSKMYVPV